LLTYGVTAIQQRKILATKKEKGKGKNGRGRVIV